MIVKTRCAFATLLVSLLFVSTVSLAAKDAKPPKLFKETAEMNVTLKGPWHKIRRNVEDDVLYPAQLTYTAADGQRHTIDVKVAPRGISRRLRVCEFPPLKVHFDKEKMKGTPFRGNNSLKLVTYCDTNNKYQQYYVKEFLIYRIYNLLTDLSFRVRPMMIEYADSERTSKSIISRFGFFIEDIDDVAKRNDLEKLTIPKITYSQLDPATSSIFSLFSYMIGNLDWAATSGPDKDKCCHNSRLIGAGNDEVPKYGVPYDFDSTGLVSAHYAAPPDGLKMRNIKQRLYRGFCAFNAELPATVELFNEKKSEIFELFESNPHLSDRTRRGALKYIEDFYEIINDPKKFKQNITDKCRGKR